MSKYGTIGIDIGGTKSLFALFDDKFHVVHEIKEKTEAEAGEKHFTKKFSDSVEELLEKAKKEELHVLGAGIGSAGWIDPDRGTLRECPSIPFLKGYPLRAKLAKLTGANVLLANDVQAGVYGEFQLGAAVGCRNIIGFFFGTGIGGAAIIEGKMYLGSTGRAGDIGHYVLQPLGAERYEILDNVASRTAIAGEAAGLAVKQQAPHLLKKVGTDIRDIKSTDLAEAIAKGDQALEALVRSRARLAGVAISNLVDFLNPDMVVLGGGLVEAMPKIISDEIETGIRENCTPEAYKATQVATAKLKDHAVTTGAAKLALDAFRATPPELPPKAQATLRA